MLYVQNLKISIKIFNYMRRHLIVDKDQKKIMLLLTEECNLNCVYCYEHFKSKRKMSFDTAKSILDDFYSTSKPGDTVLIEVFGGEPFTNFELIKQIDDYVMTVYGCLLYTSCEGMYEEENAAGERENCGYQQELLEKDGRGVCGMGEEVGEVETE